MKPAGFVRRLLVTIAAISIIGVFWPVIEVIYNSIGPWPAVLFFSILTWALFEVILILNGSNLMRKILATINQNEERDSPQGTIKSDTSKTKKTKDLEDAEEVEDDVP